MTTATFSFTATPTTETIPANRFAVAPAVFSRLCRESTACGGNLGTPDQLHITTDSDDADDLDALDDLLRERAHAIGEFTVGTEVVVLLPKQGVDGCDVWARCTVREVSAD